MRIAVFCFACWSSALALAAEPSSEPRPIPLTRPEMKQFLEDMKQRTPRIPLPELTEEEKARLGGSDSAGGLRGGSYESRLRSLYMPSGNERFSFNGGGGAERGRATRSPEPRGRKAHLGLKAGERAAAAAKTSPA
jgi:hypothetical protein